MAKKKGLSFSRRRKKVSGDFIHEIFNYIIGIIVAVILAFFISYNWGERTSVIGVSMEDTLYSGQTILISRLSYLVLKPKAGDVIVFKPNGNQNTHYYVKRVVAVPGAEVLSAVVVDPLGDVAGLLFAAGRDGGEGALRVQTVHAHLVEQLGHLEEVVVAVALHEAFALAGEDVVGLCDVGVDALFAGLLLHGGHLPLHLLGAEDEERRGVGVEVDVGVVAEEAEAGGVLGGAVVRAAGDEGVVLVAEEPGVEIGHLGLRGAVGVEDAYAVAAAGEVAEEGVGVGLGGGEDLRQLLGADVVQVDGAETREAVDVGALAPAHEVRGGSEAGETVFVFLIFVGVAFQQRGASFKG